MHLGGFIKWTLKKTNVFHLNQLRYAYLHSKTWNEFLYDSQLLTRWDGGHANQAVKIVCEVGCANNRAMYPTMGELVY